MTQKVAAKAITFEQLADLREKTESVSQFLTQRLKGHVATLSLNLAPRWVFGRYLGAKESVARAEDAYSQLTQKYREVSGAPFGLRSDIDDEAMGALEQGVEVYPWEYTYDAKGKTLTITSPVRWVITYRSDYSLSEMRALIAGSGDRRPSSIRRFVVNAIGIQIVMVRNPGITQLLEDLGYDVRVELGPGLGKLPLVTINSRIQSFRPSDDLMLSATRFSGVPAFIELIDPDRVHQLEDPFRTRLDAILNP